MLNDLKTKLRSRIAEALTRAVASGELAGGDHAAALAENAGAGIDIERPKDKGHGDLATNLAMLLAGREGKAPRVVAEVVLRHFNPEGTWVDRAEIAGPGFINFHLDRGWLGEVLRQVLREGAAYGRSRIGGGRRVIVEFVSANPTGPMVVVQARSGAVGDTLGNLLDAAGYQVHREFYVNDAGNQFLVLARTMEVRVRQQLGEALELPEEAYPGEYVGELAREYLERFGAEVLQLPEGERLERLGRFAVERIRAGHEAALLQYGVRFDRWFSEQSLREAGEPERIVRLLAERGHTYENDGATWFRSTAFGDDKDRVLVKSDGSYTYVVPDIAYHLNKFERGFEQVIDILGPDHHGYVARMRAALRALGRPAEAFEVLIAQHVRLLREGQPVSMSKRAGQFITLSDLLEEAGKDAARFFFLLRSVDSHLDFDLDLARTQTDENPVFYVQYAHARICSILRQEAAQRHLGALAGAQLERLRDPSEEELSEHLAALPGEVVAAAQHREPHRITRYALDLAGLFHAFYTRCRVLTEDDELSRARLALCQGTQIALQNSLGLLGVSAPERM